MLEQFAAYARMTNAERGLLLLPVGLAVGSFSSVLLYRLGRGQSIISPRSRCSSCGHTLGALELVPVLSFLCLGGKCRHCKTAIPWRYPLLELGCGVAVALAGALGGWAAGAAASLSWIAGATFFGRSESSRSESGFTLVEVLVASFLLVFMVVPVMDALAVARHAGLSTQRRSETVALARGRINELAGQAMDQGITAVDAYDGTVQSVVVSTGTGGAVTQDTYQISTQVQKYPLGTTDSQAPLRLVTVTVSCPSCQGLFGSPSRPVTMSSIVRRKLNGE